MIVLKELVNAAAPLMDAKEKEILDYDLDNSENDIHAYKKQIFRHFVGSQTWDKYYAMKSPTQVMGTMDFGMKWIPEYHREDSSQYFGKVSRYLVLFVRHILLYY